MRPFSFIINIIMIKLNYDRGGFMKKKLLYVFFILVMVVSGVIYYIESTKKPEEPEIYGTTPSEIEVNEEDKNTTTIENKVIKLAPDVDLNAERKKNNNNEIVGRLEIPDLINVLVVKTNNNTYYLNHAVNKKKDVRGSEFLDYRVTTTSKQINIYGHNTRDPNIKVAFIKLEKYLDKTFFEQNPYIIFQHDGGKNYYKIIAMKEVKESTNAEHLLVNYTGKQFLDHVQKMTTGSGVVFSRSVPYDEKSEIIVLQTCSHRGTNNLFTIIGIRIH